MCHLLQQLSRYCSALKSISDIFEVAGFVVKYYTMFAPSRERSAAAVVSQILGPLPSHASRLTLWNMIYVSVLDFV